MKRLLKKFEYFTDGTDITDIDSITGPEMNNFSMNMGYMPMGLSFNQLQNIVCNDDITKEQYNFTISREWLSDEHVDVPEWAVRDNSNISRLFYNNYIKQ